MQKSFKQADIDDFIADKKFAFIGVSSDEKKFSRMLLRDLIKAGYELFPVNPKINTVEGINCFSSIQELPDSLEKAFVMTPKTISQDIVMQLAGKGITKIWLQQGASSPAVLEAAKNKGINLIHDECLYMFITNKGIHGFHKWLRKTFGKMPQKVS